MFCHAKFLLALSCCIFFPGFHVQTLAQTAPVNSVKEPKELCPGYRNGLTILEREGLKLACGRDIVTDLSGIDRIVLSPTERSEKIVSADSIINLIDQTEALNRTKFFQLTIENIKIVGSLRLNDIVTNAKITFDNVEFAENIETTKTEPSIHIFRSRFDERITFRNSIFENDVIITSSSFKHSLEFQESVFEAKFLVDDVRIDSDLDLGQDNKFHDQIIIDSARIKGDLDIDGIEIIPADARTSQIKEPFLRDLRAVVGDGDLDLNDVITSWCGCQKRSRDHYLRPEAPLAWAPSGQVDKAKEKNSVLEKEISGIFDTHGESVCQKIENIAQCPRSTGTQAVLVEINNVVVEGSLRIINLIVDKDKINKLLRRQIYSEIVINSTKVNRSLIIESNQIDVVHLEDNLFQNLSSRDNIFGKAIFLNNQMSSFLSLRDNFNYSFVSKDNTIRGSMKYHGFISDDKDEYSLIWINNNKIEQTLEFVPYSISAHTNKIDFTSNIVGSELKIVVPVTSIEKKSQEKSDGVYTKLVWQGDIELAGTKIDGLLSVNAGIQNTNKRRLIQNDKDCDFFYADSLLEILPENACIQESKKLDSNIYDIDLSRCRADGKKKAGLVFDLGGADIKSISWNVPMKSECFHWTGIGLKFDNFDEPDNRTDDDDEHFLKIWRDSYVNSDRTPGTAPGPMHDIADALNERGEIDQSLEVRARAKELGLERPGKFEGEWNDIWPFVVHSFWYISYLLKSIILLPTNYGTKPELALLTLAISSGIFASIFKFYSWTWTGCWTVVRKYGERFRRVDDLMNRAEAAAFVDTLRADIGYEAIASEMSRRRESIEQMVDRSFGDGGGFEREINLLKRENMIGHLSAVPGFVQYNTDRRPDDFNIIRFSVDASLPVIDLHAYSQFYPLAPWAQFLLVIQHLLGWFLLTSFLTTLAIF